MPPRKKTTSAELGPVMQRIVDEAGEQPPFAEDSSVRAQGLQAIAVDDEAARREDFIDRAAIALYAHGWPAKTLWQRAEQLWASRVRYKQGEVVQ